VSAGTALHRSKDLAVALVLLPERLIHADCSARMPFAFACGVSVRTSRLAPDGRYPLPFCSAGRLRDHEPVLGLSSMSFKFSPVATAVVWYSYQTLTYLLFIDKILN